jgi:hypothetical protein
VLTGIMMASVFLKLNAESPARRRTDAINLIAYPSQPLMVCAMTEVEMP